MRTDRSDVVWATAVRAVDDAQHRTTSWLRLGCVALLWAAAARLPATQLPRGAGQLVIITVGCPMAFIHARPHLVAVLERIPGLRWLADHLFQARGHAKVDLPGLLEAFGALNAGLLFAGPWAVPGLSPAIRSVALLALVSFTWMLFLNIVLDAGWYAPPVPVIVGPDRSTGPPAPFLVVLRRLIPIGASSLVLLIIAVSWTTELAAVPAVLRVSLGLSPLLLQIVWVCFDQILAAAAETVRDAEDAVRKGVAQDLHSLIKNAVRIVANTVEAPQPNQAEVRALVRDLLVVVEEARLELLRGTEEPGPRLFATLWNALVRVLPDGMRGRCRLADGSADLVLSGTDYQLARRVIADLVTNAFKAGAQQVEVFVTTIPDDVRPWVEVQVRDDGPGMPADALADPAGSLRVLQWEIHRYGGRIAFFNGASAHAVESPDTGPGTDTDTDTDTGPDTGATVNVRWRSPQPSSGPPYSRVLERV
ncbi:ATP-binding protein [Frankia sp. Cr2]|uniref:ATP-binding protein n=1 Tax=Frankia sp. Cr2 TaxID=3073932 RepID=UPI002AD4E421|nr:ATP-binding protein [Frankia sp. Cr2]